MGNVNRQRCVNVIGDLGNIRASPGHTVRSARSNRLERVEMLPFQLLYFVVGYFVVGEYSGTSLVYKRTALHVTLVCKSPC